LFFPLLKPEKKSIGTFNLAHALATARWRSHLHLHPRRMGFTGKTPKTPSSLHLEVYHSRELVEHLLEQHGVIRARAVPCSIGTPRNCSKCSTKGALCQTATHRKKRVLTHSYPVFTVTLTSSTVQCMEQPQGISKKHKHHHNPHHLMLQQKLNELHTAEKWFALFEKVYMTKPTSTRNRQASTSSSQSRSSKKPSTTIKLTTTSRTQGKGTCSSSDSSTSSSPTTSDTEKDLASPQTQTTRTPTQIPTGTQDNLQTLPEMTLP